VVSRRAFSSGNSHDASHWISLLFPMLHPKVGERCRPVLDAMGHHAI
jgi:hypothetical protein